MFARYLDQVYATARTGALQLDGQNVFIYRDAAGETGILDVEFGVGIRAPFQAVDDIRPIELPVGTVATTTQWGSYSRLAAAHDAVVTWCRLNGHRLAGPRWEVYGHWIDDEARLRTDVYYLLHSAASGS